jgi:hypothetical protein
LLQNNGLPKLGGSYKLELSRAVANSVALLFFGFSDSTWNGIPLPFDLAGLGAPGCKILASGHIVLVVPTDANGLATHDAGVPNDQNLCGGAVYNQMWVFDPQANQLGFAGTNAGKAVMGR